MSGFFDSVDQSEFIRDRRTYERWREDCRNESDGGEAPFDVGEFLTPLLLYLSDGYATGTLAKRAAALLVVVAPHLLADASYSDVAARLCCQPHDLSRQVRALREAMPALKGGFRPSQTSTMRLVSLNQLRHAARKERYDELVAARAKHKQEIERSLELRQKLADSKKAANARALDAMRELDRAFGLCPDAPRRDEGQSSAPLGVRPDGSAAVGVVRSVEARERPRREGRWF
ncbi:MAG: hypothetical protein IPP19_13210 [Verrucomicrobia bacterium]|nr:hypothetical protein [Verrucomicrobiota bacterium]